MTTLVKALIAGAIVVIGLLAVGRCRDSNASIANAIAKERVRVADSVTKAFEPVIDRLRDSVTVRIDTVRRFSTRWDTVTAPGRIDTILTPTGPAVPLAQHEAVVAAGEALNRSCTLLALSCETLKDSVPKLVDLYRAATSARDSVIAHPPPSRRWGLCVAGGYGGALSEGGVRTGPSLNVGVCWRIL